MLGAQKLRTPAVEIGRAVRNGAIHAAAVKDSTPIRPGVVPGLRNSLGKTGALKQERHNTKPTSGANLMPKAVLPGGTPMTHNGEGTLSRQHSFHGGGAGGGRLCL